MKNEEMARLFSEATPYIQKYHGKTMVVKYGGNAMINEELKNAVMNDLVTLTLLGVRVVLVHGGGKHITALLSRLHVPTRFENGYRYTDQAVLDTAELALSAQVNKSIVQELARQKVSAVGVSGKDGGRVAPKDKTKVEEAAILILALYNKF